MPDLTDVSHVSLSGRPLVITDVDDVVLEFIAPFQLFLAERQLKFMPRSFRLLGNIVRMEDDAPVDQETIRQSLHDFFATQHVWQKPFEHALPVLKSLSDQADIVFLTAMPPQFAEARRLHLEALGLPFPVIATGEPKGVVAARLLEASTPSPVAFVDDMAHNLVSVGEHLPDCLLVSLAPPSVVHSMAPRPPENALVVANWAEASDLILRHLIPPVPA